MWIRRVGCKRTPDLKIKNVPFAIAACRIFGRGRKKWGIIMKNYKELKNDMILRDYLAADRTLLADERTFLAYCRTAVGLLASGVGMFKLVDEQYIVVLGYILAAIAPAVFVIGLVRHLKMRKHLAPLYDESDSAAK